MKHQAAVFGISHVIPGIVDAGSGFLLRLSELLFRFFGKIVIAHRHVGGADAQLADDLRLQYRPPLVILQKCHDAVIGSPQRRGAALPQRIDQHGRAFAGPVELENAGIAEHYLFSGLFAR